MFKPAATVGEADTIMSLFELEQWFLEHGSENYNSKKVIEELEQNGIEPQAVGGRYLFLLKAK